MAQPPWVSGLAGAGSVRTIGDVLELLTAVSRHVASGQSESRSRHRLLIERIDALPGAQTADIVSQLITALKPYFEYVDFQFDKVAKEIEAMSGTLQSALDSLKQQVTNLTSVQEGAVTLLQGIPQMIHDAVQQAQAAGATPEQVQAITDAANTIQADAQALAQAVTANTPAAGQPPAPPAEPPPA